MFSKRHYEWIARELRDEQDEPAIRDFARRLARAFERENPRFDRSRFLRACGCDE